MSTLKTTNLQHASAASPAIVLDASGNAALTGSINGLAYPTSGSLSGRNRIINGDMRIDQRNAGASVSVSGLVISYTLDRWAIRGDTEGVASVQRSTTAPAGFTNSLLYTVTTADTSLGATQQYAIQQRPEGFNVADLGWGTANAQAVTLSFWVRSSLTGTFGGAISNSAVNRSYPFSYTINAANTFEYKTVTIAGDTSGTWLTDNGIGMYIYWSMGTGSTYSGTAGAWAGSDLRSATGATSVVGTNGATFYITGVQLEAGSVATPFERRSYGQELALCQRYYYKMQSSGGNSYFGTGYNYSTTGTAGLILFPVTMRTAPSALEQSGTAGDYRIAHGTSSTTCSSVPIWDSGDVYSARVAFTVASGLTTGQGSMLRSVNSTAYLAWSAEL